MAIAQNNFNLFRGKAYEGQVSTIDVCEIVSRVVETDFLEFGRAVIRGTKERSCAPVKATTTAKDIIGFSVRTMAEPSPTAPNKEQIYKSGYDIDHVASVLRRGPMFMLCVGGAQAGSSVSVILSDRENQGRLTTGTGAGLLELNKIYWVDDVAAGEIGEIRVDGILTV